MHGRRRLGLVLLVLICCLSSGGCEDALQEGFETGVTTGVSNLIQAILEQVVESAFDQTPATGG
ncbi:MAG: hypothetical protein JSV19_12535 [Phycisphaerales bacterium]|nr:MAG: hypothetical protein JSV19_12535 [Phycisphaerales bacterium]